MKQKCIFLFFCTIFVAGGLFSQNLTTYKGNLLFVQFVKKPVKQLSFNVNNTVLQQPAIKQYLPQNFYVTQLGFFCKQEIKFEKLTKVPFRFRLGSVEDCDRLEGKLAR